MALVNAYCTLPELKAVLGDISDSKDDVALELAINAASRQIDQFCEQRFWIDGSVVAREIVVLGCSDDVDLWDEDGDVSGIATATGLIVQSDSAGDGTFSTTLTAGTDFILKPRNAAVMVPARPYRYLGFGHSGAASLPRPTGRPSLKVTAKWGWAAVPSAVQQACQLQAAQLWKAKDAVFGVVTFGDADTLRVRAEMNPIAAGLLLPFTRTGQIAVA